MKYNNIFNETEMEFKTHELKKAIKPIYYGEELTQEDLKKFELECNSIRATLHNQLNLGQEQAEEIIQKHMSLEIVSKLAEKYQNKKLREYFKGMRDDLSEIICTIVEEAQEQKPKITDFPISDSLQFEKYDEDVYVLNEKTDYDLWKLLKPYFRWDKEYDCWITTEDNARELEQKMNIKSIFE